MFASCSTGIESTKRIELSREDKKLLQPSEEEKLMAQVVPEALSTWQVGKEFICADNKAALVFMQEGMPSDIDQISLKGKTLRFSKIEQRRNPDSSQEAVIVFTDGTAEYRYRTGKTPEDAVKAVGSADLPMLIDEEIVSRVDSILRGRRLWIRTAVWMDERLEKLTGRKYVPVTVTGVVSGDIAFPMRINFTDESGRRAAVYADYPGEEKGTRSFGSLFSLTDPHLRYPSISDETWSLIQNGKVAEGMTKEECRLSLGNPNELNRGHNWDATVDYWGYPDGSYVWFKDGLVIDYRRL